MYISVWVYTNDRRCPESPEEGDGSLKLEFQAVVICLIGRLGAELALSAGAVCTLNG